MSCGDFYNGKTYWILITGGAGFTVGMIRWTFDYPDNLPGLFKEVTSFHVDPKWSPLTFIISAISLGGGAALGPEQGLVSSCLLLCQISLVYVLYRAMWVEV